jgi:hypothetical protein
MTTRWMLFASLLLVSLSLVPAGAHLFVLPNKIGMNASDYLIAQQLYRGWAYLGLLIFGAIVSTLILAYEVRHARALFMPALVSLAFLAASQLVFWTMNFPANQQTHNWVTLPDNWESLRLRWEIGHALSAAFIFAALIALLAVFVRSDVLYHDDRNSQRVAAYIPG